MHSNTPSTCSAGIYQKQVIQADASKQQAPSVEGQSSSQSSSVVVSSLDTHTHTIVQGRVTMLITDKGLSSHALIFGVAGNFKSPFIRFGSGNTLLINKGFPGRKRK